MDIEGHGDVVWTAPGPQLKVGSACGLCLCLEQCLGEGPVGRVVAPVVAHLSTSQEQCQQHSPEAASAAHVRSNRCTFNLRTTSSDNNYPLETKPHLLTQGRRKGESTDIDLNHGRWEQ